MRATLIGIDPGVVDTALVRVTLDSDKRSLEREWKVWTKVSNFENEAFKIKQEVLNDMQYYTAITEDNTLIAIEGYRPRGKNVRQDQQMTTLVQSIHRAVKGSTVVDNTGVRNVVKPALLRMFDFQFPRTHHGDLESALRIALKLGLKDDAINSLICDFVAAQLKDKPWLR